MAAKKKIKRLKEPTHHEHHPHPQDSPDVRYIRAPDPEPIEEDYEEVEVEEEEEEPVHVHHGEHGTVIVVPKGPAVAPAVFNTIPDATGWNTLRLHQNSVGLLSDQDIIQMTPGQTQASLDQISDVYDELKG